MFTGTDLPGSDSRLFFECDMLLIDSDGVKWKSLNNHIKIYIIL